MLTEFILYLTEQLRQPYLWGGQHTKLTPDNYKSVICRKESNEDRQKLVMAYCKKKFDSGIDVLYAYDCSGLGVYWLYNLQHIYKSDVNANTMMGRCVDLDTPEPPEKGWWVFRLNGKRAVHIGYMIDNEYLIEAKGSKYGVVKTKWREGDWDCWGIPKVFEDEIRGSVPVPDPDPEPEPQPEPPEPDPPEPDPPTPPEPPVVAYKVVVIGGSVNVRDSDSKAGKIMFTAHKGNRFNLIDISPNTGWYHIETYKGPAYISNREDLTCLITI